MNSQVCLCNDIIFTVMVGATAISKASESQFHSGLGFYNAPWEADESENRLHKLLNCFLNIGFGVRFVPAQ